MLEEILKLPEFPSNFNIESQKEKYQNKYNGKLPLFFEHKKTISKSDVIEIIQNNDSSNKEELLAILFWGIYFKVMARSPKSILSLIQFIESDTFEKEMNKRKKKIIESENPSTLFKSFDKELHLPGLGYAYFTKLFFFYRQALVPEKQTYPILDKWLSNAWCALDGSMNKNTEVYNRFYKSRKDYFFDGTLKREKPQAYDNYVKFMSSLSENRNGDVISLEEKLFGAHIGQHPDNNPRHLYRFWAKENDIPLKKNKSEVNEGSKPRANDNKKLRNYNNKEPFKSLVTIQKKTYLGLYDDSKSKVGYIDDKGWLSASKILKNLLAPYELNWEEGNTRGGSKEKHKTKFNSKEYCINFLRDENILSQ